MIRWRASQQAVLAYRGGRMGVAAVPGSGKTFTLSALAAQIVTSEALRDDQEVLVVTLVNSAVDHFGRQVGQFVREAGLLPNVGYRVRTLHGLCSDIVRERPSLIGLAEGFQIVDEREAADILRDAVDAWLRANPSNAEAYLSDALASAQRERILADDWPRLVVDVAGAFIRTAKDQRLSVDEIRRGLDRFGAPLPLAELGWQIYASYQRGLNNRGAVDFQDLIRLALNALELDEAYLQRLRRRWPFILEDEAQDSSLLQELILRKLAGEDGNWVRVGDPNQAIYETFTTARPELLRAFINEPEVQRRELPDSGRSAEPIIALANRLIEWSLESHPVPEVRLRRPLQPPYIRPVPADDPQPNPPADQALLVLHDQALSSRAEIQLVVSSLARWLPENPDKTAAVLVTTNKRGFDVIDSLKNLDPPLEYVELLRSTTSTREAAGAIANVLQYLAHPRLADRLARVYTVWRRDLAGDEADGKFVDSIKNALRRCERVEEYIWPQLGRDWLDQDPAALDLIEAYPAARDELLTFRELVRRWQAAVVLPIDQLILIIAQDLFTSAADLAIAHNIALVLRGYEMSHSDWRLPRFTEELAAIAKNERRFLGLDDDARSFDPQAHRGKVTVATVHSAKGLEWDRVYLMAANNYDYPSAAAGDSFMGETWFVRDRLNLQAEILAQLDAATDPLRFDYHEGEATRTARFDYAAERLRLFYVGITRARRELIITWNTGRNSNLQPALPFVALKAFLEQQQ